VTIRVIRVLLTLIIFPRTLAPFGKTKRPENQFNKNNSRLRLLSREKRGNFYERTALEARPSRGVPKAFLSGIHVPSLGRK
jgi:hypothetical protein